MEFVLIQVSLLTVGSTQINTRNTCHLHTIQRSDLLKTRESYVSFLFGPWTFCIIFPCLSEAKVSTVNSDLTDFVDVQRLHENMK